MKSERGIVLVTTSSLATNPRLVKEFEYLKTSYACTVICFEFTDWSFKPSQAIIKRNPEVQFIVINRKTRLLETLLAKAVHKAALVLNPWFKKNLRIAAFALNDRTPQLCLLLRRLRRLDPNKAVIAHNLGAFYPAVRFAMRKSVHLQIDVEDYHLGEAIYFNAKYDIGNRHRVMKWAFSKANALSFASKGIQQACKQHIDWPKEINSTVITNAFPSSEFVKPIHKKTTTIKLIWFSQNISAGRGLEEVFSTALQFPNLEFHLVGKINPEFIEKVQPAANILIHRPMPQEALHQFLSDMDIGLALENPEADGNRNWCLTNKILAYVQSGLFVLATDTFGQREFIKDIGEVFGVIIKNNLKETLKQLDISHLDLQNKLERWKQAKAMAWDTEAQKLLHLLS